MGQPTTKNCRCLTTILFLLLFVCLLLGCSDANEKRRAPALPTVIVMKVEPLRVTMSTELAGRVSAFRKAEVRPQVSGILQKRLFVEGITVKSGQALYKIDQATYEASLDSARAALAKAEAKVEPARLTMERYRSLLKIHAVSKQEYEDARTVYLQAKADVADCRAAVRSASIQLDYTDVRAPISGIIGKSSVTEGALVTASQADPMAVIQQLDPVYVDITQSSLALLDLREQFASGRLEQSDDERAVIHLQLDQSRPYPLSGTLQFTDITVDESTGMVSLRAVFPNPDRVLLPGMYVRAILNEGIDDAALLIPQLAVARDPHGNGSVYVLSENGTVEKREVVAEDMVGNCWRIDNGVQPGELVVIEGFQKLRSGMAVKVTETKNIADVRR